jgi:hypothetical protein
MFIGLCALLKRRACVRSSHPQSQVRSVRQCAHAAIVASRRACAPCRPNPKGRAICRAILRCRLVVWIDPSSFASRPVAGPAALKGARTAVYSPGSATPFICPITVVRRIPLMAATCLTSVFPDGQFTAASLTFEPLRQLCEVKRAQADVSAVPGRDP